GGVSPVTIDHVNPEAPWPHLDDLERWTERAGRTLMERLAIYPQFVPAHGVALSPRRAAGAALRRGQNSASADHEPGPDRTAQGGAWLDPALVAHVLRLSDGEGLAREDRWAPGWIEGPPRHLHLRARHASAGIDRLLERVAAGAGLAEAEIVELFAARGRDFSAVWAAADRLRGQRAGQVVTHVAKRNITYTKRS